MLVITVDHGARAIRLCEGNGKPGMKTLPGVPASYTDDQIKAWANEALIPPVWEETSLPTNYNTYQVVRVA